MNCSCKISFFFSITYNVTAFFRLKFSRIGRLRVKMRKEPSAIGFWGVVRVLAIL